MLLNACFVTLFYANAIPILYLLAAGAMMSLYVASFIVFKYFSCKPVMFAHTLNKVISKVLCLALVLHQITSVLYFYTEDIFPLHQVKTGQKYSFRHKFSQGTGHLVFAAVLLIITLNYTVFCKMVRRIYSRCFRGEHNHSMMNKSRREERPKLFSEVFNKNKVSADAGAISAGLNEYLSSYKI